MFTQSISTPAHVAAVAHTYRATEQTANLEPTAAVSDRISLSPEARAIDDEAITRAVWQGEEPTKLLPNGDLPSIPAWMGSYEETLTRSEAALKLAMRQLGISADTTVTINANQPDGKVTIAGDFPKRAELENLINNHPDLRNVLVATSSNATLTRIGAELEKAMAASKANPADADRYNVWMINITRQIQSMDVVIQLSGGHLTGSLVGADGRNAVVEYQPRHS